ncbi:hypothetical protein DOY81_004160 [Sarcophaga bullata]|nr:hypothetical protein DOY81_004160 [Sarcophaga bullata]
MRTQLILETVCLLATLCATTESLAIAANDKDGEDCKTPDNWEGECVDLYDCPALLALTEKQSKSANGKTFLEKSICGKVDLATYVCCRSEATSDLLPDTRHCGQSFHNRIYGGSSTHFNEYPWTAVIGFKTIKLMLMRRLGEWDITTDPDCEMSKNGQTYCADPYLDFGIEEFILHPNFTFEEFAPIHDIALIRLDRYVNFTEFIRPVCLPIQSRLRYKTYVGSQMVAIGWGSTETSDYSTIKQRVYLQGVNLAVCSKQYNRTRIRILDTHLCAGGVGGADICNGDSGGQLVYQQSVDFRDVYVLVGISSFGFKPCGRNGWPGVFTRVGPYMDWIQDNLMP